ncbi:tRNA lysidine(34) synthetase TilS [Naumannella halotolerans]|uniref:tRNA(Ile)-lysidine synthase n=1 Tax=Naumannella halotolerans TaxID=993414 RepID=A0A4R7J118_9ACTN|nr:tRNA lysidine(34) synthetase TilS [Naumannella halotolerans]TDT29929.1 tRNA(Ile)-lysidine synthase [Naumannella halotolerans]
MAYRALGPNAHAVTKAVRNLLADEDEVTSVTVACSGGPDSLALAAATAQLVDELRIVIVDHGLQPGSDEVAAGVRRQLRAWQERRSRTEPDAEQQVLEILVAKVTVASGPGGPEASARNARYKVLDDVAAATGGLVLLGHTLDDQAEQVLLGLTRGSGARSLAGMPVARGPYRRPLLGVRRAQTAAACDEFGLQPWYDPHNDDPRFTRVRVRTRVLPVLEDQLGPGVAEALARSAEQLAVDDDLLSTRAGEVADIDFLPVALISPEHPAIRRRMIRAWLIHHGASDLSMANIVAVERLVTHWSGQRFVEVPGLKVARSGGILQVVPE